MKPETLEQEDRYQLIDTISYKAVVPFVLKQIKRTSPLSVLYLIFNITLILLFIYMIINSINTGNIRWNEALKNIGWGTLISFTIVIPVHEAIHGLAYKIVGAKKIKVGAKLEQLIFYITADHFVVDKNKFTWIALSPFFIINFIYLAGIYFSQTPGDYLFMICLIFHSMNCIGDIALLNYFQSFKNEVYTFDDTSKEVSYFYEKIK